jgi:protein TonB
VGVERPQIVKAVQPAYTPAAMSAGIQGTVLLEAVVLADGTVGQIRVVHSLDAKRGLDAQAIRAFRDWRFTPAHSTAKWCPLL